MRSLSPEDWGNIIMDGWMDGWMDRWMEIFSLMLTITL